MEDKNSKLFYKTIMGKEKNSCQQMFHTKWISFLDGINMPYGKAFQLRIGNHLRPLLVYWGRALSAEKVDDLFSDDVTELALCVEILHKVSIIVDDLIDQDVKRHNQTTFHIQFSDEETIIFAVYMMSLAFEKISMLSNKYGNLQIPLNILYANILKTMADGCLSELTLTPQKKYNFQSILTIISKETSCLIKNSLLLGFLINTQQKTEVIRLVKTIGEKVGYLFQAMNDLEPFCSASNLIKHKGTLNMDFNHSRKNIILPYIYESCSAQEKELLLKDITLNSAIILQLYDKYQIEKLVKKDLQDTENEIEVYFHKFTMMQINKSCVEEFHYFYDDIINIAKKRLNTTYSAEPID